MIKRLEVFMNYRYLLKELVIRDIRIRYRRSFLGILWSVLSPLLMMFILTWVFSNIFNTTIENFAVYVLIGNIIFGFHSEATNASINGIIGNAGLIKKVYVPKYLFILARVTSSLVNLLFSSIALFIIMLITRVEFGVSMIALIIPTTMLYIFVLGVSLILATYNVFFRDIGHLYGVVLTAWMYFSAIFYPIEILNDLMFNIVSWNPIYMFINYFRSIILYNTMPSFIYNVQCIIISLVVLLIGIIVFYRNQDKFILYI